MKRRLVVASHNPKKVAELERILADMPYVVQSAAAYPEMLDVVEDGKTFQENARIKALAAAAYTGELAIADDSGLEVDALGGEPGVRSARYAGIEGGRATDAANNALLLERLSGVPESERTARFVCAIAIADPEGIVWEGIGTVEGRITTEARGPKDAFGYDPLFVPEGDERTFAEMRADEKDALSHRGQALTFAKEFLKRLTETG